jgi:putative nucleotidyltransferase with HDIG domain
MTHTGASYDKITTRLQAEELSTLLKVTSSLVSTLDLGEVLQIAIESTTGLLGLDTGAIYTLDDGTLHLGATTPALPRDFPQQLRSASLHDHPHIHTTVSTRAPVYIENMSAASLSPAEKMVATARHLVSVLFFPLLLKEKAIGVFTVGTTRDIRQFAGNEIDLCYILSYQISLAVANAQLYKEAQQAISDLSQAYDATLEGWSRVLDMRDHATDEHTHRVADQTVALAKQMGIPDSELGHFRRGALLHDIGKMAIPDIILQKQGDLSIAELEIMQSHPEKAHQILSHIDYLAPALDIAYFHHEKWDGTGYPRQLKGEEIPLPARIFAVVDVFDALTSDRPYRRAWTKEEALNYIKSQSGRHFDPTVVAAFLHMYGE